jgi:hypothetical protein
VEGISRGASGLRLMYSWTRSTETMLWEEGVSGRRERRCKKDEKDEEQCGKGGREEPKTHFVSTSVADLTIQLSVCVVDNAYESMRPTIPASTLLDRTRVKTARKAVEKMMMEPRNSRRTASQRLPR